MKHPHSHNRGQRKPRELTNKEQLALMRGQLDRILSEIGDMKRTATRRSKSERKRDTKSMADFSNLVAEVEATRGDVASTKVFVEGMEKQLADLAAGMNDSEDQAKVEALAADLASIRSTLPKAIAANPEP